MSKDENKYPMYSFGIQLKKLFSGSTQLSIKLKQLINIKNARSTGILGLNHQILSWNLLKEG